MCGLHEEEKKKKLTKIKHKAKRISKNWFFLPGETLGVYATLSTGFAVQTKQNQEKVSKQAGSLIALNSSSNL